MSNDRLTAAEVAQSLGRGTEVKLSEGRYNTVCPAHNDDGPSLSVSDAGDGKLLVHCHAGCSSDKVIDALRSKGLWPAKHRTFTPMDKAPPSTKIPTTFTHFKLGSPKLTWPYHNRKGELVGFVHRFETKRGDKLVKELVPMCWGRDDETGKEQWIWKSFNKPRPIYRGHLIFADKKRTVLVVEGEKTADAAALLFGDDYHVVSWPGGTGAVKFVDWETLKGREVIIWPDADAPGSKAAKLIAEILLTLECIVKRVILPEALEKTEEGWDLADPVPETVPMDIRAIAHTAPLYKPSGDSVVDRYNKSFAMVMLGDKASILQEEIDAGGRSRPNFISLAGFKDYYRNDTVQVGRTQKPAPIYWLDHPERRSYSGVVFEPNKDVAPKYNLWRGIGYDADPTGDWSLFREHLYENVAQGDESLYNWVFGWFAQMYQQPDNKIGTSLSIRGRMGSGKTIVGQIMGDPIRSHYTLVESQRYVTGNFNSHLATTLLLHADEAFFAGDPRTVNQLKGMVTSHTHRIEYKGKDSFEVSNYTRLLATSNHDFVVPAAFEERRFAVVDCGNNKRQNREYFGEMLKQMRNGGYEGLVYALMNFDLSTVDIGVIPHTRALMEQKYHSLGPEFRFWNERLHDESVLPERGDWPSWISSDQLYRSFLDSCNLWGVKYKPDSAGFFKEMRRMVPSLGRARKSYKDKDWRGNIETKTGWGYFLPTLDVCKNHFDKVIVGQVDDTKTTLLGEVNGFAGGGDIHEDHPLTPENDTEMPQRDHSPGDLSDDDIPF